MWAVRNQQFITLLFSTHSEFFEPAEMCRGGHKGFQVLLLTPVVILLLSYPYFSMTHFVDYRRMIAYYLREALRGSDDALPRGSDGTRDSPRSMSRLRARLRSLKERRLELEGKAPKAGVALSEDEYSDSEKLTDTRPHTKSTATVHGHDCDSDYHLRTTPSLHDLPTELILLITDHLPTSSIIALSHTCSRFYRLSPAVVEDLFDRYHYPYENKERLAEQEQYLKLVVRNRKLQGQHPPGAFLPDDSPRQRQKLYKCVKCKSLLDAHLFSLKALRETAETRQCLLHEGELWICPVQSLSYEQMKGLFDRTETSRCSNEQRRNSLCNCGKHFVVVDNNTIVQAIPLMRLFNTDERQLSLGIKRIKQYSSARICPHMTHNDPKVLKCFSGDCKREFSGSVNTCSCRVCRNAAVSDEEKQCSRCQTSFQFRIRKLSNYADLMIVYLLVRKRFTEIDSDGQWSMAEFNQSWLDHISLPFENEGLAQECNWKWMHADGTEDTCECSALEDDPFAHGFCW